MAVSMDCASAFNDVLLPVWFFYRQEWCLPPKYLVTMSSFYGILAKMGHLTHPYAELTLYSLSNFKSNFICIAQFKHILPKRALQFVQGVTPSVLRPSVRVRKNLPTKNPFNGKKVEETWGRATEEGSLSQDGQTCNGCHVYRTNQQKHTVQLQVRLNDLDSLTMQM